MSPQKNEFTSTQKLFLKTGIFFIILIILALLLFNFTTVDLNQCHFSDYTASQLGDYSSIRQLDTPSYDLLKINARQNREKAIEDLKNLKCLTYIRLDSNIFAAQDCENLTNALPKLDCRAY